MTVVPKKPSLEGARSEERDVDPIPEPERWLWESYEVMQSFVRGKEDIRHDRLFDLGSFAQYIDIDVDD